MVMDTLVPDKTTSLLDQLQKVKTIEFLDQQYRTRLGFLAVARTAFCKKITVGRKYCLSFVKPGEAEYYSKSITFRLYHYYQTAEVFLGSFSYPSVQLLLQDFTFVPNPA